MPKHFSTRKTDENIEIVTIDHHDKEVNVLSKVVVEELDQVLDNIAADRSIEGVVFISGKRGQFVAGADIEYIATLKTIEDARNAAAGLQSVFDKIANLKVPTVAAIDGAALGGGLELALACTWRIATNNPKTKLALPEIQLGLIPGAGGTQRLPRLIGVQSATDMILTGRQINTKKALKLKLIDGCPPVTKLLEQAVDLAKRQRPVRRMRTSGQLSKELPKWAIEGNPIGRKMMARKAREMVDNKTRGFYPASYKALDAIFEGYDTSLSSGLKIEAQHFGELVMTRESQALIHLFHATTVLKKNPYSSDLKERFGDSKANLVGVVGAGLMGSGITTVCADRGARVWLSDPSKDSIARSMESSRKYYTSKVDKRRIKRFELEQRMNHISPSLTPEGLQRCDLVIEAVFEDLNLKQKILADFEEKAGENWFFATNTSAIPVAKIAEKSKHPEKVIGMHFFSPVEKMPLLEIVVTDKTAPWVTGRAVELGQRMGKQVIVVKDGPGFYTTRALAFYMAEAIRILLEGTPIETIDQALFDFGFPVGPITLVDEVGIDVGLHVFETMEKAFPDRVSLPKQMSEVVASGRLGRKNRKGFFLYDEGGKKGAADTEIYRLIGTESESASALASDQIVDRCMMQFVNESVRCLEEGILQRPSDGDVGAVFGLGFPPFWGGPFKYVDFIGASAVVESLENLAKVYGPRFTPAQALVDAAKTNRKFFPEEPSQYSSK